MVTQAARRAVTPTIETDSGQAGSRRFGIKKPRRTQDGKVHRLTARILLYALILCTFAFTFAYTSAWGEEVGRLEALSSTDVFRKMDLKTLDGEHFTAKNFKDAKLTLVNVWGTSCAPCIAEMPELEKLNNEYAGKIQIVGIADDIVTASAEPIPEKIDEARAIMDKAGATFPTLIADMDTYAFIETTIIGTPTTFIINQNGEIVETVTGRQSFKEWKNVIDTELLKLN